MATTYQLISSVTVGAGGAANIEFTSIPATYTDLLVKYSLRGVSENTSYLYISFNGSTSNLSSKGLNGNPAVSSSALSYTWSTTIQDIAGQVPYVWTSSTFNNGEMYIPNYAGSTNKSISIDSVAENNATAAYDSLTAALWANTSAITSIKLDGGSSDTFAQYSTAYLYGIKNS